MIFLLCFSILELLLLRNSFKKAHQSKDPSWTLVTNMDIENPLKQGGAISILIMENNVAHHKLKIKIQIYFDYYLRQTHGPLHWSVHRIFEAQDYGAITNKQHQPNASKPYHSEPTN